MQMESVAKYVPKEATEQLRVSIPVTLGKALDALARIWNVMAKERGEPATWDRLDVARRILDEGMSASLQEYGGIPQSESDWSDVEKQVRKQVKG